MRTKNQVRKLKFLHTIFAVERDLIVGGQAVMEGVMMRTPSAYAIACRKADGSIVHTAEALPRWSDKYKWLELAGASRRCDADPVDGFGHQGAEFLGESLRRRPGREKELAKSTVTTSEPALVEGTTDENFTKAPVKVVMPEKVKAKNAGQSATAVGSIIFGLAV